MNAAPTEPLHTEPSKVLHQTWIVVPCYNEAQRLQTDKFVRFLHEHPSMAILFVDDGSQDQTRDVLSGIHRQYPTGTEVLVLGKNSGKAEAVRQGVLKGLQKQPTYIGYWDADLATPLDAVLEMVQVMETHQHIDGVLGSRVQLLGRRIHRRIMRHYLGRIFATSASIVLGLRVYDTQCGAKLFRASPSLQLHFSEPFQTGWIFDVELLSRWVKWNHREGRAAEMGLYELPLKQWQDISGSKLRLKDWFRAALSLVRIKMQSGHPTR